MKVDPESAGMDPARLRRIDEHLRSRYIVPGKLAGCQVIVVRKGITAHYGAFGLADRERDVPVAEDTIWRIYSMTKPVTAVALMTLYERGYFQLDDRVSTYLPAWKHLKVAEVGKDGETRFVDPRRPVQIRDLLTHTAGIGYGHGNRGLDVSFTPGVKYPHLFQIDADLDAMVARLAETPLRFHPGTQWLYSLGLDVCGKLIEIMSGKRLDEFLADELFNPLGMADTSFYVREGDRQRFAANYVRNSKKELVVLDDPTTSTFLSPPSLLCGGGGLVSTIGDYVQFCRVLAEGGEVNGRRILGPKTVEFITANHLPGGAELSQFAIPGGSGEIALEGRGFGLGGAVSLGAPATGIIGNAGEYAWGGGASTIFWADPAEQLSVVFMTQLMPSFTFNFAAQLRALVYSAIVEPT